MFKKPNALLFCLSAIVCALTSGGLQAAPAETVHPLKTTETLSIPVLDFSGKTVQGKVAVNPDNRAAVKALFQDLYAAGFRFESVTPMRDGQPQDFEKALQAHKTFAFGLMQMNVPPIQPLAPHAPIAYALAINPLSNPVLSRSDIELTPRANPSQSPPTHDSLMHAHPKANVAPEVLPFDAVYALNSARNPLPGRVTPSIEALFQRHGFVRYTGNADRAFFGVFVYEGTPTPKKAASLPGISGKQATPGPVVSPLTQAMKDGLIKSGAWNKDCPVSLERLNVVEFSYLNMQGNTYRGSVIAADILGPGLATIMQSLYSQGFPLEHPASAGDPKDPLHFGGTGAFNCRAITGGGGYSLHSYGTAIDINFGINPYIGGYAVDLAKGRTQALEIVPGNSDLRLFIRAENPASNSGYAEAIKTLMHQNGFIVWGGDWSNRTDYMHFQATAFLSYLFPHLDKETGIGLLNLSVQYPEQFHRLDPDIYVTDLKKWVLLFQLYPTQFLNTLQKNLPLFSASMTPDDFLLLVYKDLNVLPSTASKR